MTINEFEPFFLKASKQFTDNFIIDQENREAIEKLFQYFSKDPNFETETQTLDKGLLIVGNVGSGKTVVLRIFQKLYPGRFSFATCLQVADEYEMNGREGLLKYYNKPYLFDDLGTEGVKKNYGNESNVLANLISVRYDKFKSKGTNTFFTTNLKKGQIAEFYGERVLSRLKEMTNIIQLGTAENAKDRREMTKPARRQELTEKKADPTIIRKEFLQFVVGEYLKFLKTGIFRTKDFGSVIFKLVFEELKLEEVFLEDYEAPAKEELTKRIDPETANGEADRRERIKQFKSALEDVNYFKNDIEGIKKNLALKDYFIDLKAKEIDEKEFEKMLQNSQL